MGNDFLIRLGHRVADFARLLSGRSGGQEAAQVDPSEGSRQAEELERQQVHAFVGYALESVGHGEVHDRTPLEWRQLLYPSAPSLDAPDYAEAKRAWEEAKEALEDRLQQVHSLDHAFRALNAAATREEASELLGEVLELLRPVLTTGLDHQVLTEDEAAGVEASLLERVRQKPAADELAARELDAFELRVRP